MSEKRSATRSATGKLAVVICLLAVLAISLAACRGFFGQGPIALLGIDNGGDSEIPVVATFDISGSSDPDGTIASFELDFGDGTAAATGVDVSVPILHPYTTAGTYMVILTVTDNDGRIGVTSETFTIGPVMITFAAQRGSDYDIYRMQADGTNQGAVYNTADEELFPDLLRGTRNKIAYAAEDGTSWNIWTMTVTGGSRSQLTTQTASNQIQPSWSSDGETIVYASNAATAPSTTTWELYTMTPLGTSATQLTTQTPSWAIAPSYSPVSDDIVFVSDSDGASGTADGGSALWLWDDSAGEAILLEDGAGRDGDASPALVGLATGLDLPAGAGISRPTWSPDGTKIIYAAEASIGGAINIYVMNADGSGSPETLEEYVDGLGFTNPLITTADDEFCPYWLEDGSGITYVKADAGGDYQIYKVALATGLITPLTAETGDNISPTSRP